LFIRYHYNVADNRLLQHIQKGNEDGLFISSVASCSNLWALIMDAGTGFSSQVYELSHYFLHKVSNFDPVYLVELCFFFCFWSITLELHFSVSGFSLVICMVLFLVVTAFNLPSLC
jgi:hypothetical protein